MFKFEDTTREEEIETSSGSYILFYSETCHRERNSGWVLRFYEGKTLDQVHPYVDQAESYLEFDQPEAALEEIATWEIPADRPALLEMLNRYFNLAR